MFVIFEFCCIYLIVYKMLRWNLLLPFQFVDGAFELQESQQCRKQIDFVYVCNRRLNIHKRKPNLFCELCKFQNLPKCFITIKIPVISLLWYWLSCKYYINLFKIKMKFILKITFFKPMFLRKRCFRLNVFSLNNNIFMLKKN